MHWRHPVVYSAPGLAAHFWFGEAQGDIVSDSIDRTYQLHLHRRQPDSWSPENAPLR